MELEKLCSFSSFHLLAASPVVSVTFQYLLIWPSSDFVTMTDSTTVNCCRAELGDLRRSGLYASTETLVLGEPKRRSNETRSQEKRRLGLLRAEEEYGLDAPAHGPIQWLVRQ
ncbi:hypothetical protein LMH87_005636 [Akanthomyces muscarius]|uniref:Uncharacterized protein n=1 Tax=Akanthomyces muscarius TaxID=2231603 RepID=A0A9W8QP73_AKAMU|nr:hypothetical protein LMH87_005636 [Akanthomyces muscarius]KAJ4163939.1 hypothetical protein LMH87_005636 [Akanthomyces muscarius]